METLAAVSECSKKQLVLVLIVPTHLTYIRDPPATPSPRTAPPCPNPTANEIAGAKHLHFELVKRLCVCLCVWHVN